MLQESVLDLLYSKRKSISEFNYDTLAAPNIFSIISPGDLSSLYNVATSLRYAGNTPKKKKAIDDIMMARGFKKLSFGTNRVVYKFLEDQSFVVKIPLHELAMSDNVREWNNQHLLKPFCSKCFQVDQSGIIGSFERVLPITNKEEYRSVALDVFDLLVNKIIGRLVVDDVGTEYFMNIGIRKNFGVVLIDYPEVFELDGNKIYCNAPIIPGTTFPVCGGVIDYDSGMNRLICKTCGKVYTARDLKASISNNLVVIKGGTNMQQPRVQLIRGGEILADSADMQIGVDVIQKPKPQTPKKFGRSVPEVRIVRNKQTVLNTTPPESGPSKILSKKDAEIQNSIKSAEELLKEEDEILKREVPNDADRTVLVQALEMFGLRGQWKKLTESQQRVIIDNANFAGDSAVKDNRIMINSESQKEPEPIKVRHNTSKRKRPNISLNSGEQLDKYKSTFISPQEGDIDAY